MSRERRRGRGTCRVGIEVDGQLQIGRWDLNVRKAMPSAEGGPRAAGEQPHLSRVRVRR